MTTPTSGAQNALGFPLAVARQLSTAPHRRAITHFTHYLRALALRREGNCLQNDLCFPQSGVPLVVHKSQVLSVLSGNERYCWTGRNSYLASSYLKITPDLLTFIALCVWNILCGTTGI